MEEMIVDFRVEKFSIVFVSHQKSLTCWILSPLHFRLSSVEPNPTNHQNSYKRHHDITSTHVPQQQQRSLLCINQHVGVRHIACGSGHTVVLSNAGEIYSVGRGDDGRLGHGDNGWKCTCDCRLPLALSSCRDLVFRNPLSHAMFHFLTRTHSLLPFATMR
jgi:hypothetical protein